MAKNGKGKAKGKGAGKGVIARWGKFASWKVTDTQITTFDSLSMSREWVAKSVRKTSNYRHTTSAHKGPISFDLAFSLHKELVPKMDLSGEIRKWNKRVGQTGAFYIGGKALGVSKKYRLVGVDVSDVEQLLGTVTACAITLHFEQVGAKGKTTHKRIKKKTAKKSTKGKGKKK